LGNAKFSDNAQGRAHLSRLAAKTVRQNNHMVHNRITEESRGDFPLFHAILIALFLFCDQALGVPLCRFDQFVPVVFDVNRRAAL
jgi:hypothetical protein